MGTKNKPCSYYFQVPKFGEEFCLADMNIQRLLDNQKEILHLLRGLAAKSGGGVPADIRDLIPSLLTTTEELEGLCQKLRTDNGFRHQLVNIILHRNSFVDDLYKPHTIMQDSVQIMYWKM